MAEEGAPERTTNYILLVDNNVDDRFQTGMLLHRSGYGICAASTAEEAIDFMHVAPPAAIVAEAMAGVRFAARTRKDPRFSDAPVILLARMPDLDLELRTRRGDFAACLTKPLDQEKLFQSVRAAIEKTPRKNIGLETSLPARIENRAEGGKGIVIVLSGHGMFFMTEELQSLNERIPVSFELNGRTISLEAVVLYSYAKETSPFKAPGIGLKFVKISAEDQEFIKAFILAQTGTGLMRENT